MALASDFVLRARGVRSSIGSIFVALHLAILLQFFTGEFGTGRIISSTPQAALYCRGGWRCREARRKGFAEDPALDLVWLPSRKSPLPNNRNKEEGRAISSINLKSNSAVVRAILEGDNNEG